MKITEADQTWLRSMRDDWLNDIPEGIVNGETDGPINFKCRKHWFYGLRHKIDEILILTKQLMFQ